MGLTCAPVEAPLPTPEKKHLLPLSWVVVIVPIIIIPALVRFPATTLRTLKPSHCMFFIYRPNMIASRAADSGKHFNALLVWPSW
jgi:hypothetical protein